MTPITSHGLTAGPALRRERLQSAGSESSFSGRLPGGMATRTVAEPSRSNSTGSTTNGSARLAHLGRLGLVGEPTDLPSCVRKSPLQADAVTSGGQLADRRTPLHPPLQPSPENPPHVRLEGAMDQPRLAASCAGEFTSHRSAGNRAGMCPRAHSRRPGLKPRAGANFSSRFVRR